MNKLIDKFISDLRMMDTYKVDLDSEGELYIERHLDGIWINAWSLECLIDEFEENLNKPQE